MNEKVSTLVLCVLLLASFMVVFRFVSLVYADSGSWTIVSGADDCQVSDNFGDTVHPPWTSIDVTLVDEYIIGNDTSIYGVGLRFVSISIPKSATITSACLSFYSVHSWTGTMNARIAGEASDNVTASFSTVGDYNGRSRTDYVSWANVPVWNAFAWYNSTDISAIVQSIVNRGGWGSGNCMVFFAEDDGTSVGRRQFYAYEHSDNPCVLYVSWTTTAAEYDYVDSQTNVDSHADHGTHSSFASQQATDWTNDTLIEANTNTTVVNDAENFVDANTGNIDSHTGHGTSSNFTAQQDALVAFNDTLTEADTGNATSTVFSSGFEVGKFDSQWDGNGATTWVVGTNSSPGSPWVTHSGVNMSVALNANDGNLISDDVDCSGAWRIGLSFWYMVDDEEESDFSFSYYNGSTYNVQALDLGLAANEDAWYYYSEYITAAQYLKSNFRLEFSSAADNNEGSFVDDVTINKTANANYELDLEFSWTTADYDEANEYLCIRTSTYAGTAESLGVDVWDGSWKVLSAALTASAWNNISLNGNLSGATIYFRFIGKTESSDTAQNTWIIECNLVHTWSVGVNYELDLEEQFTSANFSRTNVELCVRMGAYNTTENMRLDYWNATSSAWIVAAATLTTDVWNNVSVKTYTSNASVTFTVRFVGTNESGDTERSSWDKDACLLHTWDSTENYAPTNDACDSTATFSVDVDAWVNMTVSDANLVADLNVVMIAVTTSDSKTFNLSWTQATNAFAETLDASGVCTLNSTSSVRANVDSNTDLISFFFKISSGAQSGNCNVKTTTTDDAGLSDVDTYTAEFTIAFYSQISVTTVAHTWTNATAGVTSQLVDGSFVNFTVTSNAVFSIQAKGSGSLTNVSYTIGLGNVTIHKDTLGSAISLTTTYANVGGWTSQSMGASLALYVKLWLTVPSTTEPWLDFTYILYIQVTEA